jgi:hypothetical protein
MLIKRFYAVTNFNGLISQELEAETRSKAIREVKKAIADKSYQSWLDCVPTSLEDACEIDCSDMSYSKALELCSRAGAEFEWGEPTDDSWNIYSYPVDDPNIEENNI